MYVLVPSPITAPIACSLFSGSLTLIAITISKSADNFLAIMSAIITPHEQFPTQLYHFVFPFIVYISIVFFFSLLFNISASIFPADSRSLNFNCNFKILKLITANTPKAPATIRPLLTIAKVLAFLNNIEKLAKVIY